MKTIPMFLLLAALIAPQCAIAREDLRGRDWAVACTGCHGTEGRSMGAIPAIAGMEKDRFVEIMRAFREGRKSATVMHQHARGLSDEQLGVLGDYFASRSPR